MTFNKKKKYLAAGTVKIIAMDLDHALKQIIALNIKIFYVPKYPYDSISQLQSMVHVYFRILRKICLKCGCLGPTL